MSVLIATLGGSEDAIKLGVRKMANVDKVVLIAGKPLIEVFEASEIKKDKLLVYPVKKDEADIDVSSESREFSGKSSGRMWR